MANGMINGAGFLNGSQLQQCSCGDHTDYPGARAMVNGIDHTDDIARIARIYEAALMATRT